MDTIKQLLEKFYSGETSLEEEKILTDFFLNNPILSEWEADIKVFLSLTNKEIDTPKETLLEIEKLIDSLQEETCPAVSRKAKTSRIVYFALSVAASLLLIFGIVNFRESRQNNQPLLTDTYTNPDDAYVATMKAMRLFSENFSKGMTSLENANNRLEQTQQLVQKTIKK